MPRILANRSPRARRLLAAMIGVGMGVAGGGILAGCGSEEEQPAGGPATGAPDPGRGAGGQEQAPEGRQSDQVYTVRGEVRQLPDAENPAMSLQIRHESIPDFVNRAGEVVGMNPMTMQFTPGPQVDLGNLTVGDKIRFKFDVDWDGSPQFLVTEIEPLPAETELDFSPPAPSGG